MMTKLAGCLLYHDETPPSHLVLDILCFSFTAWLLRLCPQLNIFRYHAGLQFLTAHAAFGLAMERSLQAVNPRVSLPLWDYTIDASELGTE